MFSGYAKLLLCGPCGYVLNFFVCLQQAGSSGLKPAWTNAGAEFDGKASVGVSIRRKTLICPTVSLVNVD